MTNEVEGVLQGGMRLVATKGFKFHTYEVITPGINRGEQDPQVVVGSIDEEDKIDKSYLVPQDILLKAILLGDRGFRGYELQVVDKGVSLEDRRSFREKLNDEFFMFRVSFEERVRSKLGRLSFTQ